MQRTFHDLKDRPVYGGYGSDDEMCFNLSYIAVRTGATDQGRSAEAQPPTGGHVNPSSRSTARRVPARGEGIAGLPS